MLLLAVANAASAAELFGKVVAVADGDTLTLLDERNTQHKVRLSGIDAPERRQPYGERARQHLAALVHARSVLVVWTKRDRYGRILGRVLLRGCPRADCAYTVDAGLEQIKAGLAWHYRRYAHEQSSEDRSSYAAFEHLARLRREGLWQDGRAVPPWAFRRTVTGAGWPEASASIGPR